MCECTEFISVGRRRTKGTLQVRGQDLVLSLTSPYLHCIDIKTDDDLVVDTLS